MTVTARREAITRLLEHAGVSERRALGLVRLHRSVRHYRRQRDDGALREWLRTLAAARPRWGYRRLHVLLHREGVRVNWKRVCRVYREEGLTVRRRRRKRIAVPRHRRRRTTILFDGDDPSSGRCARRGGNAV